MIRACYVCGARYLGTEGLRQHSKATGHDVMGTCPICQKPVLSTQQHTGPWVAQQPEYAWVHRECSPTATTTTDPRRTKPRARSAAAEAIFGRR